MWTPIFITALFIIDKTWKQPKYLPTDEWIKKMLCEYIHIYIHINTIEYYLAIKKNKIMPPFHIYAYAFYKCWYARFSLSFS